MGAYSDAKLRLIRRTSTSVTFSQQNEIVCCGWLGGFTIGLDRKADKRYRYALSRRSNHAHATTIRKGGKGWLRMNQWWRHFFERLQTGNTDAGKGVNIATGLTGMNTLCRHWKVDLNEQLCKTCIIDTACMLKGKIKPFCLLVCDKEQMEFPNPHRNILPLRRSKSSYWCNFLHMGINICVTKVVHA